MRTCLMVAYYFPPGGGVGVLRSLKFVKNLPESGWRPVVLTTDSPWGITRDEPLLAQVPAVAQVHRARPFFSTASCFEAQRGFWTRLFCASLMIPDAVVPWGLPAVRLGGKIIERESVAVIYSTSPPHSSHLIGGWLKRRTGLAWVVDFRDGWLTNPDRNRSIHNRLRAATLEKWQERWVVQNADRIITVSEPIRADFLSRYPDLAADKVVVITNGYDPDDLAGLERRPQTKFTFTFTGALSKQHRGPVPLLEGARALLVEQPDLAGRFQILLVGPYSGAQVDLPARFGLESVVRLVGLVSHREALAYQVNADVNVMIYNGPTDGRSAQMMSSKIFEYIGAGRPILAIAPRDTAGSCLVNDLHLGRAVTPGSPVEIAEAMYSLLMDRPVACTPAERFQTFQWRHLTRQLADVLTSAVAA